MNKLIIVNDIVKEKHLDDSICLEEIQKCEFFQVNQIKIKIKENTSLEIDYKIEEETKLDIWFEVEEKVHFDLLEMKTGSRMKVQYHYDLNKDSEMNVQKLYFTSGNREVSYASLNGENAKFTSLLKTISTKKEKYDMVVEHLSKNTISDICNHGINLKEGSITFNVTGVIPKGMSGSITNESNRIVTYNEKECKIAPNLLIEEEDVIANHSAYIGKFKEEELFYMMSRGIPLKQATMLLTKGFLLSKLNVEENKKKELEEKLETVWR